MDYRHPSDPEGVTRRRLLTHAILVPAPLLVAGAAEAQHPRPAIRLLEPYSTQVNTTPVGVGSVGHVTGVTVQAICESGQRIFLGTSSFVSTTNGWRMFDGDTFTLEVSDAGQLWVVADAAGSRLVVWPYRRN